MKVLIIGGGGREHALAWKAAQSPRVEQVYVAPGNAGTAREPGVENVPIDPMDFDALIAFVREHGIDRTIVGPEAPLVAGVVDAFREADLPCFGPTAKAAQLEGSKAYAKDFLARHRIPTAEYQVFTEAAPAIEYINQKGAPIVVKADGLAAGKGVVVADTLETAHAAIRDMLEGNAFGEAGARVVIEEFLVGEEASFICMVDGEHVLPMATSQDHKARDEGDKGPNTGGMGAYSPAPVVTDAVYERVLAEVIRPTVEGMKKDGAPFTGFLYAGLMITPAGYPKVIEFNCRLGDPETQPIMMRLQSDLTELVDAALGGKLDNIACEWDPRPALGVVLAAEGYPASVRKGDAIEGLDTPLTDAKVFHAGTKTDGDTVLTNGGRVLCVVGLGDSVRDAQQTAYKAVSAISWRGMFFRKDIGWRALDREQ